MTTNTHQHDDRTSTGSRARLELQPVGHEVGDQVRVDPAAVPAAWVPPAGVRLADRLPDLVGTVVEAHRYDDTEGAANVAPFLYEVQVPGLFCFPFTAVELAPA